MQVGTEQLRNERIIIHFPHCIFILLLGAIVKTNLTNYYLNPPFQLTWAVIHPAVDLIDAICNVM